MIPRPALLLPALLAAAPTPALAQQPRCGFGLGLEAMRQADGQLRAGQAAAGLLPARAAAEAARTALAEAAGRLQGCGCARAAELTAEALRLAEQAGFESAQDRLARVLDRARLSLGLARDRLGREGCG
ncbi:hypothetical protein [Roseicella frigidaeris]|uniref:Uncharacterized protein n=1 Tax=Roseicella frigidaeris TaxID=2230885 RepID=A0A327M5K6_9PROT|nr:hypothetical protein [Roseicella frigidaeris]RAI55338.1 hypothetical protein DOO78_23940 [Roseicella frigidaeris]